MTINETREILRQAEESTAKARCAQQEAKAAVQTMKDAASSLEHSIELAESTKMAFSNSIEKQWEDFKARFDAMNRLAFKHLERVMGINPAGGCRPSERISEARIAQVLHRARNLVVLTGAGISAESGIPTFRGTDGFWTVGSKNYQPQELATWEKYNEMPSELWRWYQYRWGICRKAKPNPGHHAIVDLQKLTTGSFTLVTQNVDGLHMQAGSDSKTLCEIHGRIDEMRCDERLEGSCLYELDLNDPANLAKARQTVEKTPKPAKEEQNEQLPICKRCGVRQRPKILWFDESYNEAFFKWKTVMAKMEKCDVLLIVGTQLTTGGPSSMVRSARESGAIIIRVDPIVDLGDVSTSGMLHLEGKSGECLPRIIAELRTLKKEAACPPLAPPAEEVQRGTASSNLRQFQQGSSSASAVPKRTASNGAVARAGSKGALKAAASATLAPISKAGSGRSASKAGTTTAPPVGIFAYGTLRPDDDSNASWTKPFNEGMKAEVAFLPGASLYVEGGLPAMCLEQTRCSVRGVLLMPEQGPSSTTLAAKLAEADKIEGYPDNYSRAIVSVSLANGQVRQAYVYHRTGKVDRGQWPLLADGDWLSRKRSDEEKQQISLPCCR